MAKDSNSILIAKKATGEAAAALIEEGMRVGIGTGSTAAFFIEALGKRCRQGLKITAVATSHRSAQQAERLGICTEDSSDIVQLDVTVDGADEIDPRKNMIKGGGGALLREKLLAVSSKEMIVIVDETKLVETLGVHPLPVEIVPFAYRTTLQRLQEKGRQGVLRLNPDHTPFLTDNGNYIYDIQNPHPILDPKNEHEQLKSVTGVVETGLFFHVAKRVIIGYENGFVKCS